MKYQVYFTAIFKRRIKKLSKRYPHIKQDFSNLLDQIEKGNFQGDRIQGFQGKVFKIRVASSDQQRGKSGGFRFIYYVNFSDSTAYMMTVYAKSSQENISSRQKQEIEKFIKILSMES